MEWNKIGLMFCLSRFKTYVNITTSTDCYLVPGSIDFLMSSVTSSLFFGTKIDDIIKLLGFIISVWFVLYYFLLRLSFSTLSYNTSNYSLISFSI